MKEIFEGEGFIKWKKSYLNIYWSLFLFKFTLLPLAKQWNKFLTYSGVFIGMFLILFFLPSDQKWEQETKAIIFLSILVVSICVFWQFMSMLDDVGDLDITKKKFNYFLRLLSDRSIEFMNNYWFINENVQSYEVKQVSFKYLVKLYEDTSEKIKKEKILLKNGLLKTSELKEVSQEFLENRQHQTLKKIGNNKVVIKKPIL